jgi:hypothetical protein
MYLQKIDKNVKGFSTSSDVIEETWGDILRELSKR